MAHRFIVGETPQDAARRAARACGDQRRRDVGRPARRGDRHGRARPTATPQRCAEALDAARRRLRAAARAARSSSATAPGPLPRANLSVKVCALTPLLRPDAPELGKRDAAPRLRELLRRAPRPRRAPAHRHGVLRLARGDHRPRARAARRGRVRATARRAGRRPAGLPARLARAAATGSSPGRRATPRAQPLVVRLVKGAYWDHEIVEARQHGWARAGLRGQGRLATATSRR